MSDITKTISTEALYDRLAPLYDVIYGALLQKGRTHAMARLAPRPGESILEVGVGTGLSALRYPAGCRVVGVDLSERMIARARVRLERRGIGHVHLCRMDAARLAFQDAEFDAIYAPYVLNVVTDPMEVAREMLRVCRPAGRIVLLNHFDRADTRRKPMNRIAGQLAARISGVNWRLELGSFLATAGLVAVSVEEVNVPRVSSVVVCRKG
jgi:phosphatidylethanolamine/phosphatidyl-N-methylethanolamine N-methyltransferase